MVVSSDDCGVIDNEVTDGGEASRLMHSDTCSRAYLTSSGLGFRSDIVSGRNLFSLNSVGKLLHDLG